MWIQCVTVLALAGLALTKDLIHNGEFETNNVKPWTCFKCSLTLSTDAHQGSHSVKVTGRQQADGIAQGVNAIHGRAYVIRAFIKLLTAPSGSQFGQVALRIETTRHNGKHYYDVIDSDSTVQQGVWTKLEGQYLMNKDDRDYARLYIQIGDKTIDYLMDSVTFEDVVVAVPGNLIHNGEFELTSLSPWTCNHCTLSRSSDSNQGSHSVKVTNRQEIDAISQGVNAKHGQRYVFRAFIKLLTGSTTERVLVRVETVRNGKHYYDVIDQRSNVQQGVWTELGGQYVMNKDNNDYARLYIQIPDKSADFLLDSVTFVKVADDRQGELIHNGEFELSTLSPWTCNHCTLTSSTDSHQGAHSVKVTGRQGKDGISQGVNAKHSQRYIFKAFIKLLNQPQRKPYDHVTVRIETIRQNGKHYYDIIGEDAFVQKGVWTEIGGDYLMHWEAKDYARVYIQVDDATTDYELDSATFHVFGDYSNWEAYANDTIEKIRKADINIRLQNVPSNTKSLSVEVVQTKHGFPFGTALSMFRMRATDPSNVRYQNVFYNNFNWAVTESSLKWFDSEKQQGVLKLSVPFASLDNIRNHGIKFRAHNVFSGRLPDWVKSLQPDQLKRAMSKRIHDVVVPLKGKVEHWDVYNEALHHAHFYENHTGDPYIIRWMFEEVHKADPHAKLFLNDMDIVKFPPEANVAYRNQAVRLKKAGVPIYGVGVQSHLWPTLHMEAMRYRLDDLAKCGLPIWITELDYSESNADSMANHFGNILRMYFGHPAIEGILLWGFWDHQHWRKDAALFNGDHLTPSPTGKKFMELVNGEWKTHETFDIASLHSVKLRGFHGDYTVHVKRGQHVLTSHNFTLTKAGATVDVKIPDESGGIIG